MNSSPFANSAPNGRVQAHFKTVSNFLRFYYPFGLQMYQYGRKAVYSVHEVKLMLSVKS